MKTTTTHSRLLRLLLTFAMMLSLFTVLAMTAAASNTTHTKEEHDGINKSEWTALTSETLESYKGSSGDTIYLPSGNYYLSGDVTANYIIYTKDHSTVNLCLNGNVLNLNGRHIVVNSTSTLNIYDCGTTPHYFIYKSSAAWTLDSDTPEENIIDIIDIKDFTLDAVKDASKTYYIKIYGGVITGGNDSDGGAICNIDTLNLYAGTICGNTANDWGGGVDSAVIQNTTFNMSGGTICGNSAKKGGGVYYSGREGGTFTMSDGTICGNTATDEGGGVDYAGGSMKVGGTAKITDNKKGSDKNNLYLKGTTVTLGTKTSANNGNDVPVPAWSTPIGVTMQSGTGQFTATNASTRETDTQYFTSDNNT